MALLEVCEAESYSRVVRYYLDVRAPLCNMYDGFKET